MQGMGWTCLEELVWGDAEHKWLPPGVLHTRGPGEPPVPEPVDRCAGGCKPGSRDGPPLPLCMPRGPAAFVLVAPLFRALRPSEGGMIGIVEGELLCCLALPIASQHRPYETSHQTVPAVPAKLKCDGKLAMGHSC